MRKESMTPKERWLAVLSRQKPDRLPTDYWATDEAHAKLLKHTGCADRWETVRETAHRRRRRRRTGLCRSPDSGR